MKEIFSAVCRAKFLALALISSAAFWFHTAHAATLIDVWRAEDISLTDGEAVGSWTSASNRTINGSVGNQPALKVNATPGGGKVVRFNPSFMTSGSSPVGGATAFSIAVVFKASAAGAGADGAQWYNCTGFIDAEQGGAQLDWGTSFNSAGHLAIGTGSPDITTTAPGASLVDGNFHVALFTWGGGSQSVYVDNRPVTTQSGVTTGARNNAGIAFGGLLTGVNQRFAGDIAEVRFYNSFLTSVEASNVIQDLTDTHIFGNLPRIQSFTANTNFMYLGSSATLAWSVTNSASVVIDNGVGTVATIGNTIISPTTTTTYTLTATNTNGVRIATTTITVNPGVPTANNITTNTPRNTPRPLTLTGSDPQGSNLTFSIVSPPAHGNLAGTPPNVTYTPVNEYNGLDAFTFKVNDGMFDSAPGTVSITVVPPPLPPTAIVLSSTNISTAAGPGAFIAALQAIDPNNPHGDSQTFTLVPGFGNNAQFTVNGNVLNAGPTFAGGPGATFSIRLRATDSASLTYEQTFTLYAIDVVRTVVINEIHYNASENSLREEFIELRNPTDSAIDISEWRVRGGVDFFFPANTFLPAHSFAVVAQDPTTISSRFGVIAFGPWSGGLNNEGEELTLRDTQNDTIDRVDFKSEFPWPIAANGGGPSMQLVNPSLDNDLGSSWRSSLPTPGAINGVFAANAAPNIRQVDHSPKEPRSTNQVVITCKVTDPDGVASVTLAYQVVAPGNFIPSYIPLTVAEMNATPTRVPNPNPAFEAPANWTTVVMHDDGLNGDEVAGDSTYAALVPQQANRTLVRYRITCVDLLGASRRAPFEDDESLNFAYFVYDGIPAYENVSATILQSLPVYFFLSRAQDVDTCLAYNGANQIAQFNGPVANEARFTFNWPAALVYDGEVYDHIRYRLRGANGRYQNGKRNWRIKFNEGRDLAAKDQDGKRYPRKWKSLNTGKGSSNRETLTFGLNEVLNCYLWNKVGVPAPFTHFFHFRVVDGAQEAPDRYNGDFWGMNWAQENYDSHFLDTHDLPRGNLYKLINAPRSLDSFTDMQMQRRYQAPFAVTNGADAVNIQNNVGNNKTTSWLLAHINYTNFFRYHVVCEAARNYDFWPSANKNAAWYFEPVYGPSNSYFGRMLTFPWDSDSSWGPNWNGGQDVAHNGIFNDSGVTGGTAGENLELQLGYRNTARELRDLLFQSNQVSSVIDGFAGRISDFVPADLTRWSNSPANGNYISLAQSGPALSGGLPGYVRDLKSFMFAGGNNAWWLDRQSIVAGGWVTRLDTLATDAAIPARPTILYVGTNGFPAGGLTFQSSAFSDPQGAGTFSAMQWRIAEVLATNTVVSNLSQVRLEWDAAWVSPELSTFISTNTFPEFVVQPGKRYRARVRHKDDTGRWSSWSMPVEFVPSPSDTVSALRTNLVFNEIMYNPPGFGANDGDELEFLELKNIGAFSLNLSGLFFSQGIDFTFPNGTTLAPGAVFLLARNAGVLALRYPGVVVNGIYTGKLNNDGEILAISHPIAGEIISVEFTDRTPWPATADGLGFSIVRNSLTGSYGASASLFGNPGLDGGASSAGNVVINEILANSTLPATDWIELVNLAATNVDISGWYLTDDPKLPQKFRIPIRPALAPGGFATFTEDDFNPTPGLGTSFSVSSFGDDVYLFSANASAQLTGYSYGLEFGASADGETFGRYINSVGEAQFPAQLTPTPAATNAGPRVGPVVISEVMYNPEAGGDEFVELKNVTLNAVALYDVATQTNRWRMNGVSFTFPTNFTLGPNQVILIAATNPVTFRAKYGVSAAVTIFGPYLGNLQDSGERLELQQPGIAGTNGVPYITVDALRYNDKTPWPEAADGHGPSLQRRNPAVYGDDPINWTAAAPTPGADFVSGTAPSITSQPQNQLAAIGGGATFTVGFNGPALLQVRWRFGGTNIPNATNATLVLTNVQLSQASNYSAVVFNSAGSVVSSNAFLTVLTPVTFTIQPASQNVQPGTNVTLTATAVGNGSVRYQWRFEGVNILNATNASYSFTGANLANHHGNFSVVAMDDISTTVSSNAFIYVLVRPGVVQHITSQFVLQGGTAIFSLSATGAPPLGYRWIRNNGNLPAEFTSGPILVLSNVQVGYPIRVVVSNATPNTANSPASGNVSLVVLPDTDGDGIADSWEITYFGTVNTTNNPANALEDPDGDGMSNRDEYIAGTNPNDPLSLLNILLTTTNANLIQFVAQTNLTYSVQTATNLSAASWRNITNVLSGASVRAIEVNTATSPSGPERYYRVATPLVP